MRPFIGITTFCENRKDMVYNTVSYNYVKSIYMAGGIPILIPMIGDEEALDSFLDTVSGLLITGGEDINPLTYGENPIREVNYTSPQRDEQEAALIYKALERQIPILGICRGIQMLNAACGGTLYQDINSQIPNSLGHYPKGNPCDNLYHTVSLEKGSRLHKIFGETRLKVNSFHHQSVKDVSPDFKVTAISQDGIIEGMEYVGDAFVIGVQWHPEDLTERYSEFLKIFQALVEEANRGKI